MKRASVNLLRDILESDGYVVSAEADGHAGLKRFFSWQPELTLLDVVMPRMDGMGAS